MTFFKVELENIILMKKHCATIDLKLLRLKMLNFLCFNPYNEKFDEYYSYLINLTLQKGHK